MLTQFLTMTTTHKFPLQAEGNSSASFEEDHRKTRDSFDDDEQVESALEFGKISDPFEGDYVKQGEVALEYGKITNSFEGATAILENTLHGEGDRRKIRDSFEEELKIEYAVHKAVDIDDTTTALVSLGSPLNASTNEILSSGENASNQADMGCQSFWFTWSGRIRGFSDHP